MTCKKQHPEKAFTPNKNRNHVFFSTVGPTPPLALLLWLISAAACSPVFCPLMAAIIEINEQAESQISVGSRCLCESAVPWASHSTGLHMGCCSPVGWSNWSFTWYRQED